jgi:hypothetical protein
MTAPPASKRTRPPALDAAVSTLYVPGLGHWKTTSLDSVKEVLDNAL